VNFLVFAHDPRGGPGTLKSHHPLFSGSAPC
jgi:hypothetical protein